jgi:hypothetical protein
MTMTLIGKYFLGTHPHAGSGVVEAAIDGTHYLVRFDAEADSGQKDHFNFGPERLCVVAISDTIAHVSRWQYGHATSLDAAKAAF